MPQNLTDGKSTLVQVMAWCCQAVLTKVSNAIMASLGPNELTHWPFGKLDLGQHQAITWTNVDFLLVRLCGIHPREISQWVPKLSLKIKLI